MVLDYYNPIIITLKPSSILDYDIDNKPILEKNNENSWHGVLLMS